MLLASLGEIKFCVMNFDHAHDNRCTAFFIVKLVDKSSFAAIVKCHYVSNYENKFITSFCFFLRRSLYLKEST
ncbi:hypothetical protein T12_12322 [Trichinella patagoniensis]|uniref:Uncharacterized protein n=1 Tax=Trichinella patagoniensis TaxID=990121 RepID=A0A0V0ZIG2_9BILA|nr:hypothetical protein T12_12322 [Trichinella patagoniensis]